MATAGAPFTADKLADLFGPDEWELLISNDSFVKALSRIKDEPSMDAAMGVAHEILETRQN